MTEQKLSDRSLEPGRIFWIKNHRYKVVEDELDTAGCDTCAFAETPELCGLAPKCDSSTGFLLHFERVS